MRRLPHGSAFLAEYSAVLIVIFLFATFPLLNLATFSYRYNMLVGAAHLAARNAATAATFSDPNTGVAAQVPAAVNTFLKGAGGITNVAYQYRINQSNINTQMVVHNGWDTKLAAEADPTNIYTIEVVVSADVAPLVTLKGMPLVPNVPGVTGPAPYTVSAQEMVETITGLNQ